MRKEVPDTDVRPAKGDAEVLMSGVSSASEDVAAKDKATAKEDAAAEDRARLKAHRTSLAQLRQNYADLHRVLSELEKTDEVKDGFVQERVTWKERKAWLHQQKLKHYRDRNKAKLTKEEVHPTQAGLLERDNYIKEQNEATKKHNARGGIFGFWADQRPHELRLDPDNMKVYSFSTFKLLYPFKHSWALESLWKKLPKAPHKVKLNKKRSTDGSLSAALLDEHDVPLIYTKDAHGFYHLGLSNPSQEDMYKVSRPTEYNAFVERRNAHKSLIAMHRTEEMYSVYMNHTEKIQALMGHFQDPKAGNLDKENARQMLEHLRNDMVLTLGLQPKSGTGRGGLSIRGTAGLICSFTIEVNKVSIQAVKEGVEKKSGIPWEAQRLFVGHDEIKNNEDLMSKYMKPGHQRTLDLIEAHGDLMKNALKKRGLWKDPALAIKESNEPPMAKKEAAKHSAEDKSSKKPLDATHKSAEDKSSEKPLEAHDHAKKHHSKHHSKHHRAAAASADGSFTEIHGADDDVKVASVPTVTELPTVAMARKPRKHTKDLIAAPTVLSRTLYVREEDGTMHIEKQEVATPGHPIILDNMYNKNNAWSVIDRGIPVDVLLEEEEEADDDEEEGKQNKNDDSKKDATILVQKEEIKKTQKNDDKTQTHSPSVALVQEDQKAKRGKTQQKVHEKKAVKAKKRTASKTHHHRRDVEKATSTARAKNLIKRRLTGAKRRR